MKLFDYSLPFQAASYFLVSVPFNVSFSYVSVSVPFNISIRCTFAQLDVTDKAQIHGAISCMSELWNRRHWRVYPLKAYTMIPETLHTESTRRVMLFSATSIK